MKLVQRNTVNKDGGNFYGISQKIKIRPMWTLKAILYPALNIMSGSFGPHRLQFLTHITQRSSVGGPSVWGQRHVCSHCVATCNPHQLQLDFSMGGTVTKDTRSQQVWSYSQSQSAALSVRNPQKHCSNPPAESPSKTIPICQRIGLSRQLLLFWVLSGCLLLKVTLKTVSWVFTVSSSCSQRCPSAIYHGLLLQWFCETRQGCNMWVGCATLTAVVSNDFQ